MLIIQNDKRALPPIRAPVRASIDDSIVVRLRVASLSAAVRVVRYALRLDPYRDVRFLTVFRVQICSLPSTAFATHRNDSSPFRKVH